MKSYLYRNTIKISQASSSGGAFTKIVSSICDVEVMVFGAIWDENLKVIHTSFSKGGDLWRLSGSKYARSKMGNSYNNVYADLLDGKTVVFSGTPCQIAGLKEFLKVKKADSSKLFLIDVICHGTPSPMLLKEWIERVEKKYRSKITAINFRDKEIGWKGYPTSITLENGVIVKHTYTSQEFIRLFFSYVAMAPSCHECPFANLERESDITIGDFWGVEKAYPLIDTQNGISLMLANTEKGEDLLCKIFRNLNEDETMIECPVESFLQYQHNLNSPTEKSIYRETFWDDYKKNGYDYSVRKHKVSTFSGNVIFSIKVALTKMKLYKKVF